MPNNHFSRRLFAFGAVAALACTLVVAAEPAYATTIVPSCARSTVVNAPPPSLACALETFQNVARLIMGITGSAALLMFVYGGFTMLTSGGVEAKVTQGKTILKNAIIGIVLVLTAFYVIDYFTYALKGTTTHTVGAPCQNGRGKWVSVGRNTVECRTTCEALIADEVASGVPTTQQHQCASSPPANWSCNDNVCGSGSGSGGQRCCAAPAPEPIAAPEE